MDWFTGLPLEAQGMFVLVMGLPYVLLATGRIVPYRQVKDWKDLYFASEGTRERALTAMERGADAIEATNHVVQAALGALGQEESGAQNP